jgi:hypothetical protein
MAAEQGDWVRIPAWGDTVAKVEESRDGKVEVSFRTHKGGVVRIRVPENMVHVTAKPQSGTRR